MRTFTIGFLGRFLFSDRMRDYLDTFISRYTCEGIRLWIAVDLISDQHQRLAERVLGLKRICPGLRLLAVIAGRQERTYRGRSESPSAQRRKRILDAADRYEVLPSNIGEFMRVVFLNRFFIGHCDLIVYSAYHAPLFAADNFRMHIRSAENPPRVQYLSDEYPLQNPVSLEPALLLAESIAYIRGSGFRIMSDSLPPELLEKWLKGSGEPRSHGRLAALEDVADVFRLENSLGRDYLLFKVFAYAYALHRDLWVLPQSGYDAGEAASMRFRQFRRLLEQVAEARKLGIEVGRYNLLDFDNYDGILKKYGWMQRLDEMNTRLCDG
ncbi:MAG: hypothetical protein KH156_12145 [Alistipes sp.]|nr:hypothetical protein [Alistipes sp.]